MSSASYVNLSEAKLINFTFNEVVNFALSGHTINIQRVKRNLILQLMNGSCIGPLHRLIITGLKRSPAVTLSLSYLITAVTLIITFLTCQMVFSFFPFFSPVGRNVPSRMKQTIAGHFASDVRGRKYRGVACAVNMHIALNV